MSVRFFNPLAQAATDELSKFGFNVVDDGEADVMICRSFKLHGLPEVLKASIVARAGVGTKNVPTAELTEHLVPVVYAPGGNADSVAELTLGKLIAAARNLTPSESAVRESDAAPAAFEKIKSQFKGSELRGKSILIHGFGNIAARFAALCSMGLGMCVYVLRREKEGMSLEESLVDRLKSNNGCASAHFLKKIQHGTKCFVMSEEYVAPKPYHVICTTDRSVIGKVDFHSVHIGDQGTPFIDAPYLDQCKDGSILINTDRGALVDEAAVLAALESGKLRYYDTDFAPADLTLRKHAKCFASPHTAATTTAAMVNCAKMVVTSIVNYLYDGKILNSKNFPTFDFDRLGATRVTVASKADACCDKDAVLAVLAEAGLTVLQSNCAKNANICYCGFDVKEAVADAAALGASLEKFGKVRIIPVNPVFVKWSAEQAALAGPQKKANFYAGPAVLPDDVVEGLANKIRVWDNGMSLVETSHRTPLMVHLFEETIALIRGHLKVPDDYDILFLQGGATFMMTLIPLSCTTPEDKLGYVIDGTWSTKAIQDAQKMHALGWCGEPVEVASNKALDYKTLAVIPDEIDQGLKYLWLGDNETIHGLEYWTYPNTGAVPLVLDMSSNIFSRHIDWENTNIGAIFAGAQKNSGIAGAAILIIKKEWVAASGARGLPNYLDLKAHQGRISMLNTPPVAAVMSINLTMKWLAKNGGVEAAIVRNKQKADMLYDVLDENADFFVPRVTNKAHRSNMNVTFNLVDTALEPALIAAAEEQGLMGLKGHRSLGGCRASIYNAQPLRNVKRLCDFLLEFKAAHQ